jgi:hypothetical protein
MVARSLSGQFHVQPAVEYNKQHRELVLQSSFERLLCTVASSRSQWEVR